MLPLSPPPFQQSQAVGGPQPFTPRVTHRPGLTPGSLPHLQHHLPQDPVAQGPVPGLPQEDGMSRETPSPAQYGGPGVWGRDRGVFRSSGWFPYLKLTSSRSWPSPDHQDLEA